MAVNISWGHTEGGSEYNSASVDHLSGSNGTILNNDAQGKSGEVWISHDGTNPITGCKFYLGQFSGTYSGGASAAADLAEMLAWGDGGDANAFGGVWLNMDKINAFVAADPTFAAPGGVNDLHVACHTGVGDNPANGVNLHVNMGAAVTSTGVIAAGGTAASLQVHVKIPIDEGTAGVREFDQKLRFTYTS